MALPQGAIGWSAVCDCGIFLIILAYFLYPIKTRDAYLRIKIRFRLFDLILYIPVNNFSVMSGWDKY